MGGRGSGGYNGALRPTVGGCRQLSIRTLVKKGAIPVCGMTAGSWIWTSDGEEDSSIGYEANTTNPYDAFLRLRYSLKDSGESVDYKIILTRTIPQYGGFRWWFVCPSTGRRVTKLYLPYGGKRFLSRHAYRLSYFSQSIDACSRAQRKSQKLQDLIDQDGGYYYRRKGMHQKTFDRIADKIDTAEEWVNYYWMRRMKRFLGEDWPIPEDTGE